MGYCNREHTFLIVARMAKRKPGVLVGLETQILDAALTGREFHGYELAQRVDRPRPLIGHGTIYKALGRLEGMGFLTSRWEEADAAERGGRPPRRLYRITAAGAAAITAAHDERLTPATIGPAVPAGR